MKAIIVFIFLIPNLCHAALEEIRDVIQDPVISRRCKSLLKDRANKIKVQQKLNSMILRNEKLQAQLKPNQKVALNKLTLHKTQLTNNSRLAAVRLKAMEENIVRKGCPGITL